MIERVATFCASWLVTNSEKQHNKSVIGHALASLISNILIIMFSIITSVILGTLGETLFSLGLLALVRKLSGGRHFPTLDACVLFSSIVVILLPFTPPLPVIIHAAVTLIFLLCFGLKMKRLTGTEQWKYDVILSICLLNIIWTSDILTVILFIQTITLAPLSMGRGVKPMLKKLATYCSKALELGKEPLEKWWLGEPSIKVSDQRSSNENSSIKADRKKRI